MITDIVLEATPRVELGKNAARRLRAAGRVPVSLYGDGKEPLAVSVNARQLAMILRGEAGRNTIFTLVIDGHESSPVLVKDLDLDPVTSKILHSDMVRISLTHRTRVPVTLEFVGNPIGVSRDHGIFDVHTRHIEVECLPKDIPEHITVDISKLEVGQHLTVADIVVDNDLVTIVTERDHMVAGVLASRVEGKPAAEGHSEG
jgi:large subunit ribosomal protein L25